MISTSHSNGLFFFIIQTKYSSSFSSGHKEKATHGPGDDQVVGRGSLALHVLRVLIGHVRLCGAHPGVR